MLDRRTAQASAAADVQHLPSDIAGCRRGEETHRIGHITRVTDALHGDSALEVLLYLWRKHSEQRCLDYARRNRVRRDTTARELQGKTSRQADHATLRR